MSYDRGPKYVGEDKDGNWIMEHPEGERFLLYPDGTAVRMAVTPPTDIKRSDPDHENLEEPVEKLVRTFDPHLFEKAARYVVDTQPPWATDRQLLYAKAYVGGDGTITAAANTLGLTVPTVSAGLRRIVDRYLHHVSIHGRRVAAEPAVGAGGAAEPKAASPSPQRSVGRDWVQPDGGFILADTPLGRLVWYPVAGALGIKKDGEA